METKELLIITAGNLFSRLGFDGVSTRMIAEKAKVKLSAIHYHFKSKENLYVKACLYAHQRGRKKTFGDICSENKELLATDEGKAWVVIKTVYHGVHYHFRADRPEWERNILVREIFNPTAAMETLAEEIFRPDSESAVSFYKMIHPNATDEKATAWADLMFGQLTLYIMAGKTVEYVRGAGSLNVDFFNTAAQMLAKAMILAADLPLVSTLEECTFENIIDKGKTEE